MRPTRFLIATFAVVCTGLINPISAQAKPAKPAAPAATTASCSYLNSSKDENTASTNAVYDPATKTLKILVTRSVPDMFWPIAESMTRDRANKILAECSTINQVQVSFQSGQKMMVAREVTAKQP
jgi:hypothetical protein